MSSKKTAIDVWDIDLERDMPLTEADLDALDRARELTPLSWEEYQRWVDLVEKHHGTRPRIPPYSSEPFTL